jgi:putative ABC transport system permease protein
MQADVADEKLDAVSQTETILSDIDSVYAGFSVAGDHAGGWYGITNFFENLCRRVGASFEEPTYKDLQEFENMSNAEFVTKIPTLLRELNEGIMNYFAYMSAYNTISSVLVFPDSLTQKEALKNYLDAYNHIDYDLNKPLRAIDDRIAYSDVTETLSESIATMINVVSVVLVVFAAISLVVSSVMTAIITYVSVMERTKEIGILRACGARKRDIGRLFEAECAITGTIAGVIGVTISYLSCIPINRILDSLYPGNNLDTIANLSPLAAILLFALSVALAFISGFIPSRIAARKDPVICLRAE